MRQLLLGMIACLCAPAAIAAAPAPAAAAIGPDPAIRFFKPPASEQPGLRGRARAGDMQAQIALARQCLAQNDGDCAVRWLTEANARGNAEAQYLLGLLYARGDGIAQDLQQGAYFLGKAAGQGEVHAQYRLGVMLSDADFDDPGIDKVPAELQRGEQLLHKAALAGYAPAQYHMGLLCLRAGADCTAQADGYLEQAAAQGQVDAAYMVASRAVHSGDAAAARAAALRLQRLAPAGSRYADDAQRLLGEIPASP